MFKIKLFISRLLFKLIPFSIKFMEFGEKHLKDVMTREELKDLAKEKERMKEFVEKYKEKMNAKRNK